MQTTLESALGFLGWLGRASWQASVVIVLVLLTQWVLRKQLSPRWRHALWFLVVIRLALPMSLECRLSLFNWFHAHSPAGPGGAPAGMAATPVDAASQGLEGLSALGTLHHLWPAILPALWLAGAFALAVYLLVTNTRLGRGVRRQRPVTDTAVLNLLEDCKQEMGVCTPLALVETAAVNSPSLFGFLRPRLLLPVGLTHSFSPMELRYVFLHELSHLKRGDIPLNWLTTAPLILHWFNPLVWYAWNRMRVDGELACDELALSHTQATEKRSYGETIIKLLERFSHPAPTPGLVGILEAKNHMKQRIRMIANYHRPNRWTLVAAPVFAALALVTLTDPQAGQGAGTPEKTDGAKDPQAPPRIVSTTPKVGQVEVEPNLSEITVTFDRDMAGGFSWTGGGPDYPPLQEGKKPVWRDKRTCVLPVKLQAAHYYRVGINSTSYQNFRSATGVPARPSAIYFATQGASEQVKRRVQKPQIAGLSPLNGAKEVDPATAEVRVTFSVPMGDGCSWTGGGPNFPTIPEGKKVYWTDDHKTCVLPVALKPGTEYRIGLNSPSHKNFQSAGGVPLDPVAYTFKTRD